MPRPDQLSSFLQSPVRQQTAPEQVHGEPPDHVLQFSRGEVSRKLAMQRLGIGYSELLDRVAGRKLPLPRVDDAKAQEMADTLVSLLGR